MHARMKLALVILGTLGLAVLAMAVAAVLQPTPVPEVPADPRKWFQDTAVLAGVVVIITQFIKPHLKISGIAVKALALGMGGVLAILAHAVTTVTGFALTSFPSFIGAASFGLSAGVLAAGGKDVLKSILGRSGSGGSPTPGTGGTLPR